MNRFRAATAILVWAVLALAFSPSVKADDWNKETVVTFSGPVEVPGGVVLPAGTYVFKLMDSPSDRHIVQVFSQDRMHLYATILAIPNYRLQVTGKTVMTFGERPAGSPEVLRAWFYPGANSGEEFVYPKRRAVELAKVTDLPVLAMPTELEPLIGSPKTVNEESMFRLKQAPLIAVRPTGEEVEVGQVVESAPAQTAAVRAPKHFHRLPKTASGLPLVALIGLLSLSASSAFWFVSRRRA